MKWSGWIVFSLAAVGAFSLPAAEPKPASPRLTRVPIAPVRFAADERSEAPVAAITPHAPVHYRQATWDIWSGTSSGYVYSPGACDYTPPCVDHLWDGYVQRPHRCYGPKMHHHCRGLRGCGSCGGCGGCDTCGAEPSCGCGCGGHASLLKRAHGWHFGGKIWNRDCSSCGDIAPSCGCDGIGGKGSYDSPAPADSPPAPMPEVDSDAPPAEAPAPAPEKAARGRRLRGFTWPESSLQR